MPGERIGNSNQYLTISGVVSAPAYSWASDNDTGLYRIGANNIGIAANGTKVLDISNTAVTITPATTLSAALTYGGVTLSNAVTGTGNMVLATSPTLTTPAIGAATATTPAQGNSSTSVATTAFVNGMSKFSAYLSTNQALATGYQKITLDATLYNVGSNFSTSTSIYTAPVTGYYLFTFAVAAANGVTASEFEVFIETTTDTYYTFFTGSLTEAGGWTRSGAVVCFMTAADTAYLRVYTQTAITAGSGHSSAHCWLTGQLVGA